MPICKSTLEDTWATNCTMCAVVVNGKSHLIGFGATANPPPYYNAGVITDYKCDEHTYHLQH